MAGNSLANTLSFLASQATGNRQIPAASDEFLQSANNPNVRNFGPGQQPEAGMLDPMLALLTGGAGKNAASPVMNKLSQSLAVNEQTPQGAGGNTPPQGNQGFLAGIMRMLGLENVSKPLLGRSDSIQDILDEANPQPPQN